MASTAKAHMNKLATLVLFLYCCAAFAADKPNIIIIYTDDQGCGDCSLLNPNSKFLTPSNPGSVTEEQGR
jgi:arylsulfatase A